MAATSSSLRTATTSSPIKPVPRRGSRSRRTSCGRQVEVTRVADDEHVKVRVRSAEQPQLRGWLVFKKDGILQVSSPTSQPWLDANLAMIRHQRAFQAEQAPLYTFSWDLSDEVIKEQGPSAADYSLAVAEAGAFHADLLLELHPRQEKGLASGDKDTLASWNEVKRNIAA